jgi:hypothetical protein
MLAKKMLISIAEYAIVRRSGAVAMSWEIAFTLANDELVQVPLADILEVTDDIGGRSCIMITKRERYRVPLSADKVREALELLEE